jgi:XTP/dITP diphosphohydrolase
VIGVKLVLATKNEGKVKELTKLLAEQDIEVLSLADFPEIEEIVENGETFKENAVIKATEVCMQTGLITLADDSGLEVDCLEGLPGVYSARFAGEEKDDSANNKKLLELLAGVPAEQRKARFKCVVAVADIDCFVYIAEGTCAGIIAEEQRGDGGFGYDPLFYLPEYDKTFAELDLETKNKISHRARAFAGVLDILSDLKKMMEDFEE